jgi:hypothetical protein
MSHYCKEYDDNCAGCQPAMMDPRTGRVMSEDDPMMIAVRRFWKTVDLEDKKACHRVWCFNSRETGDLTRMEKVAKGMEAACRLGD